MEWRFQSEVEIKKIKDALKEILGSRWFEKIEGTPSEVMEALYFFLMKYLTDRDFDRGEDKLERTTKAYKILLAAHNRLKKDKEIKGAEDGIGRG